MIQVDGIPRMSASLGKIVEDGGWTSSLGVMKEGRHAFELVGFLVPIDDECTPHTLDHWIVIEDSSWIDYQEERDDDLLGLAALPAKWSAEPEPVVRIVARDSGTAWARAKVSADHVVRDWGLQPSHQPNTGSTRPPLIIELDVVPRLDNRRESGLAQALLDTPAAMGIVDPRARRLRVLARDEDSLLPTLERIASPEFRVLCGLGPCLVGPPSSMSEVSEREVEETSVVVLTMKDVQHPNGWAARGEGRHVLSFEWRKPADWEIEGTPELVLPIRWSGNAPGFEPALLHVEVDEHPLATWVLDEWNELETFPMRVKIPKIWWDRDILELRVVADFRTDQPEPCEVVDPSMPWVSVEADARLEVPRSQGSATGIASFYQAHMRSDEPLIVDWVPANDGGDVGVVAATLYPFSGGGARGPGIHYGAEFADLMIRGTPSGGDIVQLDDQGRAPVLLDGSGGLNLPPHLFGSIAYLVLESDQLRLVPSPQPDTAAVPPFGGLTGQRALLLPQGWVGFDAVEEAERIYVGIDEPALEDAESELETPRSTQQLTARWFNIAWIVLSLLVTGVVVLLLLRRRPGKTVA